LEFLRWVWSYPATRRPKIVELLTKHSRDKNIIRLRSRAEVEQFITCLKSSEKEHRTV
jgi:hypothetical protein